MGKTDRCESLENVGMGKDVTSQSASAAGVLVVVNGRSECLKVLGAAFRYHHSFELGLRHVSGTCHETEDYSE